MRACVRACVRASVCQSACLSCVCVCGGGVSVSLSVSCVCVCVCVSACLFVCACVYATEGETQTGRKIFGLLLQLRALLVLLLELLKHVQSIEAGRNEVSETFKIASLYEACVIAEAPYIKNPRDDTLLYPERLCRGNVTLIRYIRSSP